MKEITQKSTQSEDESLNISHSTVVFQPQVHLLNSSAGVSRLKESRKALSNCETEKSVKCELISFPFEINFLCLSFAVQSHTSLWHSLILGLFCQKYCMTTKRHKVCVAGQYIENLASEFPGV